MVARIVALLIAVAVPALAQSGAGAGRPFPFDSLRATVQQPGLSDTVRVYKALEAYQALIYTRPDSAQPYVAQALALARRIKFYDGEANAYGALAGLHFQAERYAEAQRYYQLELAAARKARALPLMSSTYASMADLALETGNVPLGEQYYQQAFAILRQIPRRQYDNEVMMLYNWSGYYLNHHALARAVPLVRQAAALLPHCTWPELAPSVDLSLGRVQRAQQQPDSARASWLRAARQAQVVHLDQTAAEACTYLAQLALDQQHPAQALPWLRQALTLARQGDILTSEATATELLAQAQHALHQPEAFATLRHAQALHDTLRARENLAALRQTQARFNTTEQQARIRDLEQRRRLAAQQQEMTRLRARQQVAGVGGLALLALLLVGGLFWRYRRRQAAARAAAEDALRQQIAADLHDDVGSLLTQVSMQSDLLSQGLLPAEQQGVQLQRMATTSREAVRHMSDVVWGLNQLSHAPTLGPLLDRMHDHAHLVLPPTGLDLDFPTDPALKALPVSTARQQALYLIYKEALHNTMKHARSATEVQVRLHHTDNQLQMSIRDNGTTDAPLNIRLGHGLANMQARAQAVGGAVRYEGGAGFGVVVTLPVG